MMEGNMKLAELNPHLICVLCGGYLIDATSIVECLHSFCRTCIIHYLHTSNYCPVCEVLVHKKRPLEHIRPDTVLQDIVYKTVPGLFKNEMKRRREFYERLEATEADKSNNIPVEGSRLVFCPDEMISLCLQFKNRSREEDDSLEKFEDSRNLLCPAGIGIGHLKKFIRLKFSLSYSYCIDIYCKEELLEETYTLVDVAYISEWKRDSILQLNYAFYGNPAKRRRVSVSDTTNLPVASDDTCSNGCVSSVTNNGSDDECFEDSGCEVNDSQISYDDSTLSDIVDQQENCCGIDMSMKTMRRNSSLGSPPLSHSTPTTDKNESATANDISSKSYMTSYVTFLGQRVNPAHAPMKLPLRSPTDISKPSPTVLRCPTVVSMPSPSALRSQTDISRPSPPVSGCALNDSGIVEDKISSSNPNTPKFQNNNYTVLAKDSNLPDKPLTLKIRKPSCEIEVRNEHCEKETHCDKHEKCVGICNGHTVKSRSDKLLLRLSRDGDSNTYTASMS